MKHLILSVLTMIALSACQLQTADGNAYQHAQAEFNAKQAQLKREAQQEWVLPSADELKRDEEEAHKAWLEAYEGVDVTQGIVWEK